MPILELAMLETGDVLLQSGNKKIARHTGTAALPYSHASLIFGRLAIVHAPGPGKIVCLEALDLTTWTKGEEEIVGHRIDGAALIRRPKRSIDETGIVVGIEMESGRPYANAAKLSRIADLSATARAALQSGWADKVLAHRARHGEAVAADGLSCAELVSRILNVGTADGASPNALATDPEFTTVTAAVHDEDGWTAGPPHPAATELRSLVSSYDNTLSPHLMAELDEATGDELRWERVLDLQAKVMQKMEAQASWNIHVLNEIETLSGVVRGY